MRMIFICYMCKDNLYVTMIYKGKKFDRRMGENEEWFAVYFN